MSLYQIDPSHSNASFSVKHMMIAKVHGGFEKISGKLAYDPTDLSKTTVDVSIETASINTRDANRDQHLKGADFFDVEKYPTVTFKSTRAEGAGDTLRVTGDLTLHGVTKSVTLEMEKPSDEIKDPWGNIKIGTSGGTKIKRKDFGLIWNAALEAGGVMVGDDVAITLDTQWVKQS
jgi:polyisoprenoid-binding protein YceI